MTIDEFKASFADLHFSAPATPLDIVRAEQGIGVTLPDALRHLYLCFDGMNDPTFAPFLYPLLAQSPDDTTNLVAVNRWLRDGVEFPHDLMSSTVMFGSDGCGAYWGVQMSGAHRIIEWTPADDGRVVADSPLEVWVNALTR